MANPFTTRSEILGLPIGPQEPDWSRIFGFTLVVLVIIGLSQAGLSVKKSVEKLRTELAGPKQAGEELIDEGKHAAQEISRATDALSG